MQDRYQNSNCTHEDADASDFGVHIEAVFRRPGVCAQSGNVTDGEADKQQTIRTALFNERIVPDKTGASAIMASTTRSRQPKRLR